MPTAKELTAKRLRDFGESLLNDYEILLAGQLRRVQEDLDRLQDCWAIAHDEAIVA